jgi:hypothetical protein
MRIVRSSVLALMLSSTSAAMLAGTAQAQISVDVSVNLAPPPLPFYEQPVIPAEGYIWVPGFWAWDETQADYYWVPGTWVEPPQPELLWTPAYWGWDEGRYRFHSGYWGREVGFYGGIDYGYGYGGEGYAGGRWDNGHFFYNRSVNNIENVRITNVYNQTVVVNNRVNVSFNGGNGGTTVRPTAQQETFARERHVEATPLQRQHVETASKDRALFSKQNHGEPAVAATARPGVFQGAGVSHGSRAPVSARPHGEPNGAERPAVNRPMAGEKPAPGEPPRGAQPRPNEREAPAAEQQKRPAQEPPRAEQPRRPAQEPTRVEEPRRPEPPRVEQPHAPAQEPPRVEEQRRPVQEPPRANEMRPAAPRVPERPAGAPARPPAEEKKRE